jgi:LuxR family maltose regulon positive regulatory protein
MVFDEREYALVFDDFHLIDDEEIVKSLLYVLTRLPLSVTVLFLSRAALPQAFLPLHESGKIALVGAEELAFDADEIRRYFASLGRFVTGEDAARAFCETEGWAIAVNALAISQGPLFGEDQKRNPLEKYIRTQIWDKLDGRLRRFMLETCAVDKLSAGLCEQMTQNPESREILDMLSCRNMFLSRQDGEYRYHQLFLDFLRREAETADPAGRHTLYRRAAGYYSCAGDHFNALRFSLKGEDATGRGRRDVQNFEKRRADEFRGGKNPLYHRASRRCAAQAAVLLYRPAHGTAFCSATPKACIIISDRLYERIVDIMKM